MDCNREEALKAKEIAERKFNAKDIKGAKKLALKAQKLFPSLEGISQLVSTLNVYIAAEKKINGESDWYEILSVSASTDEEELKKHYRKLALQLHPDKNKSIGAEGAFKLISEAWSVLSDKSRKMVFDQMRNANSFQSKASEQTTTNSVYNPENGLYSFSKTTRSSKKARKGSNGSAPSVPQPHPINLSTFWTSCNRCRMQYEYLRVYLNHNLLCPNCHQAFLATEIGIPGNAANSSIPWSTKQHQQNLNNDYTVKNGHSSRFSTPSIFPATAPTEFQHGGNFDSYNYQNFQWSSFTGTAVIKETAFQAAKLNHKKFEKMRRRHEKAQAAAQRAQFFQTDDDVHSDSLVGSGNYNPGYNLGSYAPEQSISKVGRPAKRSNSDQINIYHGRDKTENMPTNIGKIASDVQRSNGAAVDLPRARMGTRQNSFIKEFSHINIREMLIECTKATIGMMLKEWNLAQEAELDEKDTLIEKKRRESAARDEDGGEETHLDSSCKKNSSSGYNVTSEKKVLRPLSIDVPDSDFYNFDNDRLEQTFEGDQVWATYDSEDGMPRLYAMVQKVLSRKPFRIRMSFLSSKSNSELGPINWVAAGFAKTCGDFRVSRYQISDTVNIFSHRVRWEKGPRGIIRIIPRKGDIWALYKNWSPDWDELTPNDVVYKYEMVEVLDDYQEEHGVSILPLVKVAGFKSVFHRHMDQMEAKRISREEMFRFSHQVPSYLLTGEEAHNSLEGCFELDPAATPVDLLQIIREVKEDVGMEINQQQSEN